MNALNIGLLLTSLIFIPSVHAADLNVDVTNIGVQITGATTIRVTNLSIVGQSIPYTAEFAWDAKNNSFRLLSKAPDVSTKWKVTSTTVKYNSDSVSFSQDLSGLCTSQFGFGYVQADWLDVKNWINNDAAKAQTFINSTGLKPTPVINKFLLATFEMKSVRSNDVNYVFGITSDPGSHTPFVPNGNILGGTLTSIGKWAYPHISFNVLCNNKTII